MKAIETIEAIIPSFSHNFDDEMFKMRAYAKPINNSLDPTYNENKGECTMDNNTLLEKYIDQLNISNQNLKDNIVNLENKINAKFDKIDSKFDKIDSKFDKIDSKLDENKKFLLTTMISTVSIAVASVLGIAAIVITVLIR